MLTNALFQCRRQTDDYNTTASSYTENNPSKGHLNKYNHNWTRPLLEEAIQIHAKIKMPN